MLRLSNNMQLVKKIMRETKRYTQNYVVNVAQKVKKEVMKKVEMSKLSDLFLNDRKSARMIVP